MTLPDPIRHNVNFITGNANKLREVKAILEPAIQVDSQTLDLIEIQGTIEEVTLDKCRRAADLVFLPFFFSLVQIVKFLGSDEVMMGHRLKAQFWWKIHVLLSMLSTAYLAPTCTFPSFAPFPFTHS